MMIITMFENDDDNYDDNYDYDDYRVCKEGAREEQYKQQPRWRKHCATVRSKIRHFFLATQSTKHVDFCED